MSVELHPISVSYFKSLIEEVTGPALVAAAGDITEFTRGFRPGHVDETTLRQRALAAYGKSHGSKATLNLLRNLSLQRPLIAVLSEEALRFGEIPFTRYFGTVPFFSAMAIDPRPTVAEFGLLRLKGLRDEIPPRVHRTTANLITKEFKPFFETLRAVMEAAEGGEPAPGGATPPPSTGSAKVELRQSQGQLQKLVDGNPAVRRMRRELAVSNGRLSSEIERRQALEIQVPALEIENRAAHIELARLRDEFETALSVRVADIFDKRLGALFRRTSAVVGASPPASDSQGGGAIAAAKRVLAAQALADAQYGTRTALAIELEEARTLRDALQEAQLEALRPLPDIQQAAASLSRLIGNLETCLGVARLVPSRSSDSLKRFLTEVRATKTISEIAQKRHQLEAIRVADQWSAEEITVAEEALHIAALQHYEGNLEDTNPRDAELLATASPLNAFRVALIKGRPAQMLIDGHNVLHQLRPLWGQHFEQGKPGARARAHLTSLLAELCAVHPSVSVDLWFDSGVLEQTTVSARMRVLFSGGTGADRADNGIAYALEHIHRRKISLASRQNGQHDVFVVSADRDVRASAKRLQALAMYPTELRAVLGG